MVFYCTRIDNIYELFYRGPNEMGRGGPRGGSDELSGRADPALPVVTGTERAFMSKNVSTIVAAVATLISTCVICFFVYMAVKKLKVSTQCRNALGKSGILCFHKGKVSHNLILCRELSHQVFRKTTKNTSF